MRFVLFCRHCGVIGRFAKERAALDYQSRHLMKARHVAEVRRES